MQITPFAFDIRIFTQLAHGNECSGTNCANWKNIAQNNFFKTFEGVSFIFRRHKLSFNIISSVFVIIFFHTIVFGLKYERINETVFIGIYLWILTITRF